MHPRIATFVSFTLLATTSTYSQQAALDSGVERLGASGWRAPQETSATAGERPRYTADARNSTVSESPVTPTTEASSPVAGLRATRAQVTKGSGTLPNEHGQVWREYDISPYSLRIQNSSHPEQGIVDWILRETGYEAWHSTPVGLLSADERVLRVYHTPQMQAVVADIVDRFVNSLAENHGFGLRIITIQNPNWRTRALPLMTPIPVQSPGVQGWMMAKEDAALLMADLKRRTDYREHNPPHQMVRNGESLVVSSMKARSYTKGIVRTDQTWPGYQPELGQLDEGFSLEFSPLLALDTKTVDAVVKVRLAQVEKMLSVKLEVPSTIAPNQRAECQVPQMTMVQLHERFRWPTDQVLLLSMGVVATPGPSKPNLLTDALPLPKNPPRADALLFVESRGPVTANLPSGASPTLTTSRIDQTYHGRY
ncbi:MAG: hypothetical protein KDA57_04125 [Planctomycetales bacterium]|nr:hypothetical protein [Planctomycetales bacterium]